MVPVGYSSPHCFGEGCGYEPPTRIIPGNREKTGMGRRGQRRWDEAGGDEDSCNMQTWGFAFAEGRMSGPASK